MNLLLAIFFGILRTPALLFYVTTGIVHYVMGKLVRTVLIPLSYVTEKLLKPNHYLIGLGGLLILYKGYEYLRAIAVSIADTEVFLYMPVWLLSYLEFSDVPFDRLGLPGAQRPLTESMLDFEQVLFGKFDVIDLYLVWWWFFLGSQLGLYIYYAVNRLLKTMNLD